LISIEIELDILKTYMKKKTNQTNDGYAVGVARLE
jgi:hypothetical protein